MTFHMIRKWFSGWVLISLCAVADARSIPDPTRPPWVGPSPRLIAPTRTGVAAILWDGPRRLALIDGHVRAVGARVGASRIIAISRHAVVLEGRYGKRTLLLADSSGSVKKIDVVRERHK